MAAAAVVACQPAPAATTPRPASPPATATATPDPGPSPTPPSPFVAFVPGVVELSTVVPTGPAAFGSDRVDLAPGCRFTTTYGPIAVTSPPCPGDVADTELPVLNAAPGAVLTLAARDPFLLAGIGGGPPIACGQIRPDTLRFAPQPACAVRVLGSGQALAMPAAPDIWVVAVSGCDTSATGDRACGTWYALVDTASAGWTPLPTGAYSATMRP